MSNEIREFANLLNVCGKAKCGVKGCRNFRDGSKAKEIRIIKGGRIIKRMISVCREHRGKTILHRSKSNVTICRNEIDR